MTREPEHPAFEALRERLEQEEAAYAEVLAAVDRLAAFPLPSEQAPEVRESLKRLNELWPAPERPAGGGLAGALRRRAWDAVAPALERQTAFNAALVQMLNAYVGQAEALHARLRDLGGAIVHYAQRVQPLVDARDRLAGALVTLRSELLVEARDRSLVGLLALRDRLAVVSEELGSVRATLSAAAPSPDVAAATVRAAASSSAAALEGRLDGPDDEVGPRRTSDAERFAGPGPVVDLACGRGELLLALRGRGIPARGVALHASAASACRAAGLDVVEGDAVDFLRAQPAQSLGGLYGARLVERLPPASLTALLAEAHRALRKGGLLLLETPNPRSVVGLLEGFHRDPAGERPLHPETLRFLAAAAGFSDVRLEMRAPVETEDRLLEVPGPGLAADTAKALNENVARLNSLLFGHRVYALLARR